ncbi:KATNB1-like protein 1 [Corticium candelabrum]|uniref:KATNB1-like protein 1 n=1 Tax=Corticium candelabrum TaxID=121492 RepID=UPI002E25E529|nr:KATNB1-like protein 1 [Corticium candelabrum]
MDDSEPDGPNGRLEDGRKRKRRGQLQAPSDSKKSLDDKMQQLLEQHSTMLAVFASRKTRVYAAKTQCDKDINAMVDYMLRIDDETLTADLLPVLLSIVQVGKGHNNVDMPSLSMGACLELLPLLHPLLDSEHESYVIKATDFLLAIVKHWWNDFLVMTTGANKTGLEASLSTPGVYTSLVAMTDKVGKFVEKKSKVGTKAKALFDMLLQLQ